MRALFGHGEHPDSDAIIAAYLEANVRAGMTGKQLEQVRDEAIRAARLGRPFPGYKPLDRFDNRVNQRLQVIKDQAGREPTQAEIKKVKTEEARRQRAAVAGFDLVFSPVKSAALLWALDERGWVRDAIRAAHEQALREALALVEEHAAYTRTGTGGIAQIPTRGLVAAAFEHWDSRAGDPNLHTHVAVSSKVQGTDGKWRSLDARALYRMTVAASECYNTAFEAALTGSLGVTFTPRPDTTGEQGTGAGDNQRSVRNDRILLPPPRRDRSPVRRTGPRLPRASTATTRRRRRATSSPSRPTWIPGRARSRPAPWQASGRRGRRN